MTAFYTCIFSLDSSMGPYVHSKCYCMFVKQVRVAVPEEKQGAWYIQEFYAVKLPWKICWLFSKMIKYYFSYTVPLLLVFNVKESIVVPIRITDIFFFFFLDTGPWLQNAHVETRKKMIMTVNEY